MVALRAVESTEALRRSYYELPSPVVLVWGEDEEGVNVGVFTRAIPLGKRLRILGKTDQPLRMVVIGSGVLQDDCLRGLNLFLRSGRGLRHYGGFRSKYDWTDLCSQMGFRFVTLPR